MSEKLCIFCTKFDCERFSENDYWGAEGGFFCHAKHFYEVRPDEIKEFRRLIERAAKCPDYDEAKP